MRNENERTGEDFLIIVLLDRAKLRKDASLKTASRVQRGRFCKVLTPFALLRLVFGPSARHMYGHAFA